MDFYFNLTGWTLGVYAGLVTLGLLRGTVRWSIQPLKDLLKLLVVITLTNYFCSLSLTVLILAVLIYCLYSALPSPRLPAKDKAVFITGCDRGLGHQLAITLDSLGVCVYAGCLFPAGEGASNLKSKCSERLQVIPLDVSDSKSVQKAAEMVKQLRNGQELWGIVNNAGILFIGCFEIMSEEDIKKILEVNFMGQIYVLRAFLPLIRASHGRVVNVASNSGLAPVPFLAMYCASKAAVYALTECLHSELQYWNVKLSTIIPSGYRTGILGFDRKKLGEAWLRAASDEVKTAYGEENFFMENKTKDAEKYLNPDLSGIINCMIDALLEHFPQPIYYKGLMSRLIPFLYYHLPICLANWTKPLFTWYKFNFPPRNTKSCGEKKQD